MAIAQKQQKVTFNLPSDLKEKLIEMKKEYGISLSAIYTEALKEYIRKKEKEKWRKAAQKAKNDYLDDKDLAEFSSIDGDEFYEY
ncbi:type II toxin-antitoxin system CcdA family antitoxin [Hydrogenimonas sp.]